MPLVIQIPYHMICSFLIVGYQNIEKSSVPSTDNALAHKRTLECDIAENDKDNVSSNYEQEAAKKLKCKKQQGLMSLLHLKYLTVTNFTQLLWCEQQLVYRYTIPIPEEDRVESPAVTAGSDIHLARGM